MTWRGQAGQDAWVHSLITDGPGMFIDVGAYDGIEHSNTYALETEHDWGGICIEPQPIAFEMLRNNRPGSICRHAAAGAIDGTCRILGDRTVTDAGTVVPLSRLDTIIAGATGDTCTMIDYLSIDVEGDELEVLAGMDFDRWHVRLITIEHNLYRDGPTHKDAIHRYLTGRGFERAVEDVVAPGYGKYEDWYRNAKAT
jgi:FkbM family methyltransferase